MKGEASVAVPMSFIHLNRKMNNVISKRFHITVVGYRKTQQNLVQVFNDAELYLVVLFHDPVRLSPNRETPLSEPNTLVIYDPGSYRCYGNTESAWSHSWFRCGGSEFDALVQELQLPLNTPLPLPAPQIFEKYLLEMDQEIVQQPEPSNRILGNFVSNCLFELRRSIAVQETPEPVPQAFQRLKTYIELNYCRKIALEELVLQIHMSRQYVCKKFKSYFGYTPIDYAIRLKMQLAATLLRDHRMQVKNIANEVGIENVYYFSKLFKKHFGIAPRLYRSVHPEDTFPRDP
jgi:AraC-like DNA-binding protein